MCLGEKNQDQLETHKVLQILGNYLKNQIKENKCPSLKLVKNKQIKKAK